jgi:ribonucleoside-triphosphate reductase
MRDIASIEAEIAELKLQLQQVKGTPTEVYTRIVGYYRSVNNWNKGKREEYNQRRHFDIGELPVEETSANTPDFTFRDGPVHPANGNSPASFLYFYRKNCAPCKPVGSLLESLPLEGEKVDVDTEEGLKRARDYNVMSTPTVLFFDRQRREVTRAHDTESVEQYAPEQALHSM